MDILGLAMPNFIIPIIQYYHTINNYGTKILSRRTRIEVVILKKLTMQEVIGMVIYQLLNALKLLDLITF